MELALIIGFIFIGLSYFIGSWPVGRSVGKFFADIEVQETGSGVTGATNIVRASKSMLLGIVVGLTDGFIKGACWMLAVQFVFGTLLHMPWIVIGCFIAVILGHNYPALTNFKTGGKGIAVLIGGSFNLVPATAFILAILAWFLAFHFSRGIRSLCNLIAISVLLVVGAFMIFSLEFLAFIAFALFLIWYAHWSNLKRIKAGTEDRSSWEDLGNFVLKLWEIRLVLRDKLLEMIAAIRARIKLELRKFKTRPKLRRRK